MEEIDLTQGYNLYETWKESNEIRNNFRMNVVDIFGEEKHGNGRGENASKYEYCVEKIKIKNKEYKITLTRPTTKYNFDFYIHVRDYNFAKKEGKIRTEPKHDDIKEDLIIKKQENIKEFSRLIETIKKIYNCEEILQEEYESFKFKNGIPTEILLKLLKWLFLEQDITYWNGCGRKYILNFFIAPIVYLRKDGEKVTLEYKSINKNNEENILIVGKCNNNFSLDGEKNYYYSNTLWTKYNSIDFSDLECKSINKYTTYLKEHNEIEDIRTKRHKKWIDDINKKKMLYNENVDYIICFDNNFFLYSNENGEKIDGINGIGVKNEDFKKLLNIRKNANCIVISNSNKFHNKKEERLKNNCIM